MAPISTIEYQRRVNENTEEYLRQDRENCFDIKKYHGFDVAAGTLGRYVLASKTHDILAAVVLGFLPVLHSKSGTDAIRLDGDVFVHVELKTSYTDELKFIKTKAGAIYSATSNKIVDGSVPRDSTTSFKSNFEATYKIVNNIESKYLDTYLLLVDSRNDLYVVHYCYYYYHCHDKSTFSTLYRVRYPRLP